MPKRNWSAEIEEAEGVVMEQVGMNVGGRRLIKNMTQEVLAKKLGITQSQLSKIECGKSYFTPRQAVLFCQIVSCTMDDLYSTHALHQKYARQAELVDRVLSILLRLNPDEQESVLKALDIMSKYIVKESKNNQ